MVKPFFYWENEPGKCKNRDSKHEERKHVITTRDLMDRYNIKTRQGIIQFVKKHLDEINHDGEEHATMQKGEWAFDTEAVRILDQLRGLHDQATITELESEKVSNAQQESHNLRILLLKAQQDLNTAQQQVITLQQNLIAKQNELSEVKVKALKAQQNKDQADALQSELDRLKKEGSIIEDEHKQLQETLATVQAERDSLRQQLAEKDNRHWWEFWK